MEGDGVTVVFYCPNSTEVICTEPDANPVYCTFVEKHLTLDPSEVKDLGFLHSAELLKDPVYQVGDINSNEKGSGARFNAGKPDFSLIPLNYLVQTFKGTDSDSPSPILTPLDLAVKCVGEFQMGGNAEDLNEAMQYLSQYLEECAHVFEYGKKKYAAWNWAKGMAWSIPIACICRHYMKIIDGETVDAESGQPHEGHILCNIVMLKWYIDHYQEGDDRYKGVINAK